MNYTSVNIAFVSHYATLPVHTKIDQSDITLPTIQKCPVQALIVEHLRGHHLVPGPTPVQIDMVAQCPQKLPLPFFHQKIPSTVVKATLHVCCVMPHRAEGRGEQSS